jgi:hypothetical protein
MGKVAAIQNQNLAPEEVFAQPHDGFAEGGGEGFALRDNSEPHRLPGIVIFGERPGLCCVDDFSSYNGQ